MKEIYRKEKKRKLEKEKCKKIEKNNLNFLFFFKIKRQNNCIQAHVLNII